MKVIDEALVLSTKKVAGGSIRHQLVTAGLENMVNLQANFNLDNMIDICQLIAFNEAPQALVASIAFPTLMRESEKVFSENARIAEIRNTYIEDVSQDGVGDSSKSFETNPLALASFSLLFFVLCFIGIDWILRTVRGNA